jgi:hypothetical protein
MYTSFGSRDSSQDLKIRPLFRILGALFLTFVAYVLAEIAIPLFSTEHVILKSCMETGRRGVICYVDKMIYSLIPPEFIGSIEGVCHIFVAVICMCLVWLLARPMIVKYRLEPSLSNFRKERK